MTPQELGSHAIDAHNQSKLFYTHIALDATPHSRLVVENLHYFMTAGHTKCDFVYVLPDGPTEERKFSHLDDEMQNEISRVANEYFDQYSQILSNTNLLVNERYFIKDAKSVEDGILEHIDTYEPDLLVMGMHERYSRRKGWRISSTSYSVATHSPGSVLVIKRPVHQANKTRVLFATDGSPYAERALQQLMRFLPKDSTEITLMNVVYVSYYMMPLAEPYIDYAPLERAMQGEAQELLDRTRQTLEHAGYYVANSFFTLGDPVDQILEEAKNNNTDVIVLGSHGTGKRVTDFLLGNVSSKVLEYSDASVAILK